MGPRGQDGVAALWYALGRLAVSGVPLRLATLCPAGGEDVRADRRPGMSLAISRANYGRPYPPAGGTPALPPPQALLMPVGGAVVDRFRPHHVLVAADLAILAAVLWLGTRASPGLREAQDCIAGGP